MTSRKRIDECCSVSVCVMEKPVPCVLGGIECSVCSQCQWAHATKKKKSCFRLNKRKKWNNLHNHHTLSTFSQRLQTVCQDGNKRCSEGKWLEYGAANVRLSGLIITPGTHTKNKHVAMSQKLATKIQRITPQSHFHMPRSLPILMSSKKTSFLWLRSLSEALKQSSSGLITTHKWRLLAKCHGKWRHRSQFQSDLGFSDWHAACFVGDLHMCLSERVVCCFSMYCMSAWTDFGAMVVYTEP